MRRQTRMEILQLDFLRNTKGSVEASGDDDGHLYADTTDNSNLRRENSRYISFRSFFWI